MDEELANLRSKIQMLQILYFILFIASLILLVGRWVTPMPPQTRILWAVTLGGAILTRIYRTSLVNRYNAMISSGRPPPLV